MNNLAILPRSNCASENADEVNASRTLLHRAVRQTNECRPRTRHDGDEGKAAKRALAALQFSGQFGNLGAKKTPTGAEQPFGTIVEGHAPGEAPRPPHPQSPGVEPRLL